MNESLGGMSRLTFQMSVAALPHAKLMHAMKLLGTRGSSCANRVGISDRGVAFTKECRCGRLSRLILQLSVPPWNKEVTITLARGVGKSSIRTCAVA